jgi:hypothetical protein
MTCSTLTFVDGIDIGTGVEKHCHDFDAAVFELRNAVATIRH